MLKMEEEINKISYRNRTLLFSQPIKIERRKEDGVWGVWIVEYKKLDIVGFDLDYDKAWENFNLAFFYQWTDIGKQDDNEMSPFLKEYKKLLNQIVEKEINNA